MDVSEAVAARTSIRAFLDTPVPDGVIQELVEKAGQAPSGGNVQPWRIYVLGSGAMGRFQEFMAGRSGEAPAYEIYPPKLWEPGRSNRFTVGEQMYELLGIARDDKPARLNRMMENYKFFGAPAALFCFIDRDMLPPQWSDLGMYLQTFMLLAQEAGLSTCAQESWSAWPTAVAEFMGAPDEQMLFCGVAIGHPDPDAPVNTLRSERMDTDQWVKVVSS